MTVDITQEEMNVLNLNGISAEDVKANVEYSRAMGLDDNAIRAQFSNTINELKPITKVSADDSNRIKEWQDKGPIAPYEYAKRNSVSFDGTYSNIAEKEYTSQRSKDVQERIEKNKQAKAERDKRVNEGTASFWDSAISALDRWGEDNYNFQQNNDSLQTVELRRNAIPQAVLEQTKTNSDTDKPIDFSTSLNRSIISGSWIPFIGGYVSGADAKKERDIAERIKNGETIREDELNFINHRLDKRQEESVRGYTLGGNIAKDFLPSLLRFGGEIMSGQFILQSLGLASEIPAGASIGQKLLHGAGEMLKTGAVNTLLPIGWNNIYDIYQERMLNNEVQSTDKGEYIFKGSDEKPAIAFTKSLGQTFIMFASEASGELLGIPVKGATAAVNKYVGTPISKYLQSNKVLTDFVKKAVPEFSKLYEKMNNLPVKGECVDWLKSKVKFDGFIEELGEEVVEDVLNLTIGTNNEERSLENYAKAIFKSPDEWAVLTGAIALQGGTLSVASHILGSHLEKNGATNEQILDVLQNLSENEKEQVIEELIQNGELNIDETTEQKLEKNINSVTESLLQSGKFSDKTQAEKVARLGVSMLSNISEKTGISAEDLIREDMADIEQLNQEMLVDENGMLHGGIQHNQQPELTLDTHFDNLLNELDSFENNDNTEELERIVSEIDIIEKILGGETLSIEDMEKANDLISRYEENGNNEIATQIRDALENPEEQVHYQKATTAGATSAAEYLDAKKEWEEKGTESKYFKKWFGDSKVVDRNGKPIIAYHGTESNFKIFKNLRKSRQIGANIGFFFTDSKKMAKQYGNDVRVLPTYLSLQNPLIVEPNTTIKIFGEEIEITDTFDFFTQLDVRKSEEETRAELIKQGYDGIILRDTNVDTPFMEDIHDVYVAFNSEQIKSVNNRGTFDSDNPNIYLQTEIDRNNIERNFGDTVENITEKIREDIENILADNDVSEEEFKIEDIRIYGSYSTGQNKETSDLDFLVSYSGTMREDGAFNMFADNELSLTDKNGKEVNIDINPINLATSGTIDEHIEYMNSLQPKQYFQSAYHGSPHKFDEFSLDNIGSGEGAQAHGWGLYFAENKNISEDYMRTLGKTVLKYKGKEIPENEMLFWNSLYENGKKDMLDIFKYSISQAEQTLQKIEEDRKYFGKNYQKEYYKKIQKELKMSQKGYKDIEKIDESKIEKTQFGQLYKVDIPDKDVLLDENELLSEQNENVQKLVKNIIKKEELNFKGFDPNGKDLYIALSEKYGSDKKASEILNYVYGIKGITYDGRQDGRCYVVFDDKAVKILETYYQTGIDSIDRSTLYNNLPQELKDVIDFIYNGESVFDITGNEFPNNGENLNKRIYNYYKENFDNVVNVDNIGEVILDRRSIKDSIYHGVSDNKIHAFAAVPYVLKNGKMAHTIENYKGKKESRFLFVAPVTLKGEEYFCEVIAKKGVDKQAFYLHEIELKKKLSDVFSTAQHGTSDSSKSIIADLIKNFNPMNQQKGVNSIRQRSLLIDNERVDEITNRLTKVKGSFIPAENLIRLFKDADESTIVHEFAHWWLEKLVKYSEGNEEIQADLEEIRKFVKNNGEAFTPEQHERFARGFEAYMRTGSARTNRLKKLFEDFKNALLSLYDSIKSLGFDEAEIPEINNLFDRLLTTENQRIQAAVFDRCNALQAQIQEIKNNQEKELAEIDELERNNLERNLQDNKKQKQIAEYLRLANKATSRVPKAVKEYQQRYKNATFEILEAVTGYKRQFIANPKNWELIEEKVANAADELAAGGMRSNWLEFYSDTGISYANDEIDGDYKLAQQAYDKMVSGDYSPNNESFDGEEEIGKFFGMFDYLAGKVMSLRGENKDAAFEALSSLFDKLPAMPDGAMQEITEKLNEISNTFIDQKSQEKPNSRAITSVSLATQFRSYVTSKLHSMKSYDSVGKRYIRLSEVNKLYTMLKYANNNLSTKEIIRQINAHAINQLENRQKHILHKEIQKQIRINSKLLKVGALKQGKFDWKTNTVFHELQELNRLSLEDAKKEYLRIINADAAILSEERESIEDNPTSRIDAPTDFQKVLKMKFLEYKGNKTNDLNLAATRSLLEDILELKFEGRRAKNEQELKKALSRFDYQNNLIDILNKHRNNKVAKYLARWTAGDTLFTSEGTLANWESLLTNVFDKATAEKYSLLKSEADTEVYAHKKVLEFYNKALDIYGLRNKGDNAIAKLKDLWDRALDVDNIQPIVDLFQEYENEGHTYQFKQITFNKDTGSFVETNVEITHAQLITLYAWSLNPELKKRLITQFIGENNEEGESLLNEIMFSKLSDQDKEFAWAMIDICDSMYNDTNEVFIRTTGLSLPRVENYIPSKTERIGSDIDMMHENLLRSTNPSFIKQRVKCSRIKMEPLSPLEIIIPHINKTSRYIVMSEKVNFYNRIFQSPDVKAALIDIYGKKSGNKIHRIILNQLASSTYENYAKSITVGKNLMDAIASNYITSRIGGNLKVMFSQLTSIINYAENMPAHDWANGFKDALSNPKETIYFMYNNCSYLQARLAGNSQNEIISRLTSEADRFRALRNFCTANTKFGDILAIMFGGKPYVDYLIKNGMTQEEAFDRFVEDTLRSQQAGHNSATSAWQKSVSQNALTRMIFAFNNTNFQYERKWVDAISNFSKGDISKNEFAKAFLIYKVFNPILFSSFLSNLSILVLLQNMFGGGDDDPIATFGGDILASIALSNWNAYGLLGKITTSIISAIAAKATGGKFFENSLPLISDFETSLKKLLGKKQLQVSDYIEMLAGVGDYTTGIATTRLYNAAGGVGDIAQGEFATGLLRILGYGEYRARLAATGQKK